MEPTHILYEEKFAIATSGYLWTQVQLPAELEKELVLILKCNCALSHRPELACCPWDET